LAPRWAALAKPRCGRYCLPGVKTGDQISPHVGGGLQMQTDLALGPAADVWVVNNWHLVLGAMELWYHKNGASPEV
jgi:hypothetical protein